MEQSCEVRFRRLLKVSTDIQNRMAEVWALREAVRTAEAALRSAEPIHPASSRRRQAMSCAPN
jgi:hypothetical protein